MLYYRMTSGYTGYLSNGAPGAGALMPAGPCVGGSTAQTVMSSSASTPSFLPKFVVPHLTPAQINYLFKNRLDKKKPQQQPVKCETCSITLNSQQQAEQHFTGKAHLKMLRRKGLPVPEEHLGKLAPRPGKRRHICCEHCYFKDPAPETTSEDTATATETTKIEQKDQTIDTLQEQKPARRRWKVHSYHCECNKEEEKKIEAQSTEEQKKDEAEAKTHSTTTAIEQVAEESKSRKRNYSDATEVVVPCKKTAEPNQSLNTKIADSSSDTKPGLLGCYRQASSPNTKYPQNIYSTVPTNQIIGFNQSQLAAAIFYSGQKIINANYQNMPAQLPTGVMYPDGSYVPVTGGQALESFVPQIPKLYMSPASAAGGGPTMMYPSGYEAVSPNLTGNTGLYLSAGQCATPGMVVSEQSYLMTVSPTDPPTSTINPYLITSPTDQNGSAYPEEQSQGTAGPLHMLNYVQASSGKVSMLKALTKDSLSTPYTNKEESVNTYNTNGMYSGANSYQSCMTLFQPISNFH